MSAAFLVRLHEGETVVVARSAERAEEWSKKYFGLANYRSIEPATDDDVRRLRAAGEIHGDGVGV